jgi:hypothetical protein
MKIDFEIHELVYEEFIGEQSLVATEINKSTKRGMFGLFGEVGAFFARMKTTYYIPLKIR